MISGETSESIIFSVF